MKRAFDRQAFDALSTATKAIGAIFVFFSLLSLIHDRGSPLLSWMIVGDVATAGSLAVLATLLTRRSFSVRRVHAVGFVVASVIAGNLLLDFACTDNRVYLGYMIILIIACGAILLSLRWLLVTAGLALVSSALTVGWALPLDDFLVFLLPASASFALAVVVCVTRRRAVLQTDGAIRAASQEADARRDAERALRKSEKRLELAIAGSQGAWWDIAMSQSDPETIPDAIKCDPLLKSFMGFADDELSDSRREIRERMLPEDREKHAAAMADHLAGRTELFEVEFRVRHKNGGIRWIYSRGRIQRDENGKPLRWSGIDWDITDSREAESRLRLLNLAIEQSPSLVLITSTDGTIEYVNERLVSTTGYTAEEVIGKKPSIFKSDDTPPEVHRELWQVISAGRRWTGELKNRRKDGTQYWVNAAISPIKDAAGVTQSYLSLQEDITERRKAAAQLARTQNLESLGHLVSGVAHDFNNLLTAVIGSAEIGLHQVSENSALRQEFVEIKNAGEEAAQLTRQLLAFSRQQVLAPRVLDLNEVVISLEGFLRSTIRENVELCLDLSSDLGAVRVDPVQTRQILISVATNARDAMPNGGSLTLKTRNVELGEGHSFGSAVPEAGDYVLLTMSDTGHGMTEETQARVFEPFFSTKSPGQGSGLGLAATYGVVKQSGGFISISSEEGVGTSVEIYFPRSREVIDVEVDAVPDRPRRGKETILVVEDNPVVRRVTARALRSHAYEVLTASDGEEALRDFSDQKIDLLLSDVVMPGMNGPTLVEKLREAQPTLRVILMSGYAEAAVLKPQVFDSRTVFLNKPFRLDDLLSKVTRCLQ